MTLSTSDQHYHILFKTLLSTTFAEVKWSIFFFIFRKLIDLHNNLAEFSLNENSKNYWLSIVSIIHLAKATVCKELPWFHWCIDATISIIIIITGPDQPRLDSRASKLWGTLSFVHTALISSLASWSAWSSSQSRQAFDKFHLFPSEVMRPVSVWIVNHLCFHHHLFNHRFTCLHWLACINHIDRNCAYLLSEIHWSILLSTNVHLLTFSQVLIYHSSPAWSWSSSWPWSSSSC